MKISVAAARHGQMIFSDSDATIGPSLKVYGEWAEYELELLEKFISPGDTVFDVGANIGCHTLAFSRAVGPSGKVYAFEPFSTNFAALSANCLANGADNVVLTNALVGTAEQFHKFSDVELSIPESNFGAISYQAAIETPSEDRSAMSRRVTPMVTLDTFKDQLPSLIKIDVEGMELDVLLGASELLKLRPAVYFEQNSEKRFGDIWALLDENSYALFWHRAYPFNINNYNGFAENLFVENTELNVLALPFEKIGELDKWLRSRENQLVSIAGPAFFPPVAHRALAGRSVRDWSGHLPPANKAFILTNTDTIDSPPPQASEMRAGHLAPLSRNLDAGHPVAPLPKGERIDISIGQDLTDSITVAFTPIQTVLLSAWSGHVPTFFVLMNLLSPRRYVELGTHFGMSFFAACQAAQSLERPCHCIAIDTWAGDEHAGYYDDSIFETFVARLQEKYADVGDHIRGKFDEALSEFDNGSVDLLHIDGLHTYEAVKHDFETWLPKMSDRGVVMFHDISERQPGFGVWKLWEEVSSRYPSWTFIHTHGLGIAYVGDAPFPFADMLRDLKTRPWQANLVEVLSEGIGRIRHETDTRIKELTTEILSLRTENETLAHQVLGLENLLSQAQETNSGQAAELGALRSTVHEQQDTIAEVYRSTSWKLTRPLRLASKKFRPRS